MEKETITSWIFRVEVGKKEDMTTHEVELEKNYWEDITGGRIAPQVLVLQSFFFLLEKESQDRILPTFNLKEIQNYFKDFERTLSNLAKS